MRKILILGLLLIILILPSCIYAQSMMGNQIQQSADDHTAQEEVEGKNIWDKLQAKQLNCSNFTDDNYDVLGEYVMGQSIGNTQRHAFMNQMMKNMMGEQGETQMHIALGKRFSGCGKNASYPQNGWGFTPMMWMMGSSFAPWSFGGMKGGDNPMMGWGGWNNMMGGWGGFGLLSWIPMIIFWALLILGIIAIIRYLGGSGSWRNSKTPLDILKERYAKGEIDKKEFEDIKKDLR